MTRTQRFTAQQIIDAIPSTGGIMALVAQKLGCDRVTIWRYAKRYSTVRLALEQADEAATDMAEAKALLLINSGYWPTIKYRLSTKGKNRGYTTRTEHTGPSGEAIPVDVDIHGDALDRLAQLYNAQEDALAAEKLASGADPAPR